jgi:hypothetical protein
MTNYTMPPAPPPAPEPPRGWWSRNWKWVVPVGCLLPIVLLAAFVAGVAFVAFTVIRSSDVYAESMSRVKKSDAVRARLGEPIESRWWILGSLNIDDDRGEANLRIPIRGPRNDGTVRVVATKRNSKWYYAAMRVDIGEESISLLTDEEPSPPESTDTAARDD